MSSGTVRGVEVTRQDQQNGSGEPCYLQVATPHDHLVTPSLYHLLRCIVGDWAVEELGVSCLKADQPLNSCTQPRVDRAWVSELDPQRLDEPEQPSRMGLACLF